MNKEKKKSKNNIVNFLFKKKLYSINRLPYTLQFALFDSLVLNVVYVYELMGIIGSSCHSLLGSQYLNPIPKFGKFGT